MGGVGDELPLRARGVLERGEHRVERRGEPRELVAARDLDPAGEVARLGHVLGRAGEPAHGREQRRGDDQAERGGDDDAEGGDQEQPVADPRQRVVDLVERARDLERVPVLERQREHANVRAGDVRVGEERALLAARRRAVALADGQLDLLAERADRRPGRRHELRVAGRAAEEGGGTSRNRRPASGVLDDPQPRRRRPRAQRLVDLAAQLVAHEHVGERRRGDDGERHGERAGQDEPRPEAHGSRSA